MSKQIFVVDFAEIRNIKTHKTKKQKFETWVGFD
jgi:hypothetical protein